MGERCKKSDNREIVEYQEERLEGHQDTKR